MLRLLGRRIKNKPQIQRININSFARRIIMVDDDDNLETIYKPTVLESRRIKNNIDDFRSCFPILGGI